MSRPTELFSKSLQIVRTEGLSGLTREGKQFYYFSRLNPSYWRGQFKDELEVSVGDVTAKFDTKNQTAKNWFYPQLLDRDLHEAGLTRRLLEVLEESSVFYDLGANVGYFTILASVACRSGEVHAFEIDRNLVHAINDSLRLNGSEATIVQRAVSDTSNQTLEYVEGRVPEIKQGAAETREVETITIDDYVSEHTPPDVMKVDVEGFEHNVLMGARGTFEQGHPEVLFLEIHPDRLQQNGSDKHQVISLLQEYGYEFHKLADQWDPDSELTTLDPEQITDNTMVECRIT